MGTAGGGEVDPDGAVMPAGRAISRCHRRGQSPTTAAFVISVACLMACIAGGVAAQRTGAGDPFAQILGSTYLGGVDFDCPFDVAVAADGTVVIVGETFSPDLPVTAGAWDTTYSPGGTGLGDAFVARIDPQTGTVLACTYLGGSSGDVAHGVAVDRQGKVYCSGKTRSADFPVTPGAFSTTKQGLTDMFVVRFDAELTTLEVGTFLGGSGTDGWPATTRLSEAGDGAIILAGSAEAADMPVTPGAFDTSYAGAIDGWIGALSLDLSTLEFGTFVGGTAYDGVGILAVDSDGSLVFVGDSQSQDFPQTVAPWPTSDGRLFVARLSSDGSQLLHSGFIGGSNGDWVSSIAIDAAGIVYFAGGTWSDDFPVTPGVYDPTPNTLFEDGILFCLAPDLRTLLRSTFSGTATKSIWSMAIDSTGSPTYITGTNSGGFAGSLGAWSQFQPSGDGNNWILVRLDPEFSEVLHATYLGGSGSEADPLVRMGDSGRAIIVGDTASVDYPVTPGASQITAGGGLDAVITLYSMLPKGVARFGSSIAGCTGDVVAGATQSASAAAGWTGLTCTGAPPSSGAGLLGLSLSGLHVPVPAKGVSVWLNPAALVALLPEASGASGFARTDLHLPGGAGLIGLEVAAQFFWMDPCGPLGWTSSDALRVVIVD